MLKPSELWDASAGGAEDDEADDEGRMGDAGLPLSKGDSAGKGSPNNMSVNGMTIPGIDTYLAAACMPSPWPTSVACRYSCCCSG